MNAEHSGCVRTDSETYRPIVIVADQGMYFFAASFADPALALAVADEAIESGVYTAWHFHATI